MLKKTPNGDIIDIEVVTVTPEMAEAWMDRNINNRRPSRSTIIAYATDMLNGSWHLTGDAIRFDTEKRLIDGQHRLAACIEADTPFDTMVIYNLDPSHQDVIDVGKKRTVGDMLSLHGMANTSAISTVLRLMMADGIGHQVNAVRVSASIARDMLEDHKRLPLYCLTPGSLPKGISIAPLSFINYVGSVILQKPSVATQFIATMKTGIPAYENCPVHLLRERLLRAQGTKTERFNLSIQFDMAKMAWNHLSNNVGITRFRIPTHVDMIGVPPQALFRKAILRAKDGGKSIQKKYAPKRALADSE